MARVKCQVKILICDETGDVRACVLGEVFFGYQRCRLDAITGVFL